MNASWDFARKPLLVFCFFLLLFPNRALGQAAPRVVEPVNNAQRVTLRRNVHPLAQPQYARGAVSPSQPMQHILLLLERSDAQEAALQLYMEQQQDKSSSHYHVWLTSQQFGEQFGPADSDVQAVTQWLSSQGFTVEKVYSGKTIVEFSGTAAQLQSAFGATMQNYEINGKTYTANANDPQIPAALAPVIAGIVSLNNFPRQSHIRSVGQAQKIAGKPGLQPLFTFPIPGGSTDFYGVGPADFATIYNSAPLISSGNNGSGQTIAIVGETDINVADVQAFRQIFGLPANFTSSNIILNGEDPGVTSTDEELEADLDVQWSGAVAPGATIDFVVSASTPVSQGIDLSSLYIIENNLAGVMSESYGNCEASLGSAGNSFYNSMWEQAAAQGITVILSAGDGGSAGCDDFHAASTASLGLAVSGLASTPYNVALGGTDFDDVNKWSSYWNLTNNSTTGASALSYIPEIPWSENCAQIGLTGCGSSAPQGSLNIVAGSGGASSTYGKPSWQMGVTGMPNDSHRDLPDLSLFASPGFDSSGYVVCPGTGVTSGPSLCNITPGILNFAIVGGTSASAPAFAGIMALLNQFESAHSGSARQGNANYILYALAKKTGASCASSATEATGCVFNDIVKGNSLLPTGAAGVGTNSVPCAGATPNCSSTVASANGVLVEPASLKTEAWTVTTGYDLATGLGTVNINNLVTQWSTVSTVATTTTLTLSPTTSITHGSNENVTVDVTVTPTTGTATGIVALIAQFSDGSTQGLDQFTLSSGKITNATTNSLPGGSSYQVHAHYAGDGTNAPSDSAPVTVTVAKESSQTFIVIPTFNSNSSQASGNTTSLTYGSNYIIEMVVTNAAATANPVGLPNGMCGQMNLLTCPTGSITLTDNGVVVGAGAGGAGIYHLNTTGYSQNLTPSLTGGTHSLVATYSGDNSYQSSVSATDTLTITPAPTSQQWQSYPSSIVIGQQFTISTSIGTGVAGAAPTGTVTFYDGSTALAGPVTYTPFGVGTNVTLTATGTVGLVTAGSHTVTAQYSGDVNYGPSTSSPVTITALYPTTIQVTTNSTNINFGQSVTLTATVTSSGKSPPMSGQLQFFGNSAIPGPVTTSLGTDANGNQVLTGTVSTTPQFTEPTSANYTNDPLYESGSVFGPTVTVNIPDFSIPNGASVNINPGATISQTINITPLSSTPSTVSLNLASGTPPPGFTVTLSPLSVNLNGSAAPVTLTVTTIGASSATPAVRPMVKHAATLRGPMGDWWLLSFSSALGFLILLMLPKRKLTYRAATAAGVMSLVCLALGCGGGGGGGGSSAPTITIATSNASVPFLSDFNLTATVTSSKPLSGTVTFAQNGVSFANGTPLLNGQATISMPNTGQPQIVTFTASYSGDSQNSPAQTQTGVVEVYQGTLPILIQGQTGGLTRNATYPVVLQ